MGIVCLRCDELEKLLHALAYSTNEEEQCHENFVGYDLCTYLSAILVLPISCIEPMLADVLYSDLHADFPPTLPVSGRFSVPYLSRLSFWVACPHQVQLQGVQPCPQLLLLHEAALCLLDGQKFTSQDFLTLSQPVSLNIMFQSFVWCHFFIMCASGYQCWTRVCITIMYSWHHDHNHIQSHNNPLKIYTLNSYS